MAAELISMLVSVGRIEWSGGKVKEYRVSDSGLCEYIVLQRNAIFLEQ